MSKENLIVFYKAKCMIPECNKICFVVGYDVHPSFRGVLCSPECEEKYKNMIREQNWKQANLTVKNGNIVVS